MDDWSREDPVQYWSCEQMTKITFSKLLSKIYCIISKQSALLACFSEATIFWVPWTWFVRYSDTNFTVVSSVQWTTITMPWISFIFNIQIPLIHFNGMGYSILSTDVPSILPVNWKTRFGEAQVNGNCFTKY